MEVAVALQIYNPCIIILLVIFPYKSRKESLWRQTYKQKFQQKARAI